MPGEVFSIFSTKPHSDFSSWREWMHCIDTQILAFPHHLVELRTVEKEELHVEFSLEEYIVSRTGSCSVPPCRIAQNQRRYHQAWTTVCSINQKTTSHSQLSELELVWGGAKVSVISHHTATEHHLLGFVFKDVFKQISRGTKTVDRKNVSPPTERHPDLISQSNKQNLTHTRKTSSTIGWLYLDHVALQELYTIWWTDGLDSLSTKT